jgi:cytochrome P450
MLTRYVEVVAALRDPQLTISAGGHLDEASHRELRESARALTLPDAAEHWAARFAELPPQCDLIGDVAEPMCLELAAEVTGLPMPDARKLSQVARGLFEAEPEAAAVELMRHFQSALRVQAFAALCHTLPAFLGNAWQALLEHPAEMERPISPDAMEELLRFAGPSTAVFRYGAGGERITLRLADANRDPGTFPEADRLKLDRRPAGHLAFGAGPHSCVGAPLVRQAAQPAITQFVEKFAGRTVAFQAEPREGITLRSLRSLLIRI